MKIVRLYTGADNESHFEDIEVELHPIRDMAASAPQPTHGVMFYFASPTHLSNHHPAPRRQYVVTLSGSGDRNRRRHSSTLGAGDVMLAEDTTGRGHITRVVGGQPRHYLSFH
jgi:hypothetical protein